MNGVFLRGLVTLSLALSLIWQTQSAQGAINSTRSQTGIGSTGIWSSNVTSSAGTAANSSYQVTWTGNSNKQYELISILNSGNFDLIAGHLTFSTAKGNGDTTNPPTLTFETCTGTWDTITYSCSGTISLVGSANSGQININRYLISGNRLVIRVTNARNNTGNHITTINSLTFRSDIRYGMVLNS